MLSEHKLEVLRAVEASELPVRKVLDQLEIPCSTYYRWRHSFRQRGMAGLRDRPPGSRRVWNQILPQEGSDPGDGPVVSRAVPTGGQLPGHGYLWVYGLGILGLPDSKGRRTDPGGSTPRLSGRIGVSNQDHENQPAVANGCDLLVKNWGWYYLISVLVDFSRRILGLGASTVHVCGRLLSGGRGGL